MYSNKYVFQWVEQINELTKPENIVWIDGSEDEKNRLTNEALSSGELIELNQKKLPGCYYHQSDKKDVARVEHRTFICTKNIDEVGPTNNWMHTDLAYSKLSKLFDGAMKGRTMYVIPFIMGPKGSKFSKVGIEITDSIYVVLNMRLMTRMGIIAMEQLGNSADFTKGLHSKGDLNIEKRYICHFPEDNTIWSFGSGYGGNALLGKKCLALRIASTMGRKEGWLAEHMLILGLEDPTGKVSYIAAAFPSACGKTNLAMLVAPITQAGYKVWTVGDDIAWMRIGEDGRLWAVNPEAGFFGVAPGTSLKTNPNALKATYKNTIFTNVARTVDGTVWWEGLTENPPPNSINWKGESWDLNSDEKGAHPNSRFTAPANQCPSISPEWESPNGVPISAIIFGGRRAKLAPLVHQSFDWEHGVFVGATMASETTAAATGTVGLVRRDPMAMLPFCGYNMADYFQHWIEMGKKIANPPKIFHVNWFRTEENGKFIWPGFGENIRVLKWILERCENKIDAKKTSIGYLPLVKDLDTNGLGLLEEQLDTLMNIDNVEWLKEIENQKEFFIKFGDRLPKEIIKQMNELQSRLEKEAMVLC